MNMEKHSFAAQTFLEEYNRHQQATEIHIAEINSASQYANPRHNDVVDKGFYDSAEGSADDDTNRHINKIAFHGKIFELL